MSLFSWGRKAAPTPEPAPAKITPDVMYFERKAEDALTRNLSREAQAYQRAAPEPKKPNGVAMDAMAMDSSSVNTAYKFNTAETALPDALFSWYASQSFIGWQACAIISQHWLVDNICTVPIRDAVRNGYELASTDNEKIDVELMARIKRADTKRGIIDSLIEFDRMRKIFGIRLALFKLKDSTFKTPAEKQRYYEQPFNIDSVKPGSYEGIAQIDPYWVTPWLDNEAVSMPTSVHYYEPTYWQVSGVRIHHTHFVKGITSEVPDVLKPSYIWGGIPLPQQLMQRVYAAERTANEAPQLLLSMRSTVLKTNTQAAFAKQGDFEEKMSWWAYIRDNFGIKVIGTNEEVQEFTTNLAGVDKVIASQYNLVAAIGGPIPIVKLFGESPKGMQSTGEHDTEAYDDLLRTLQAEQGTPFLTRHYEMLTRSEFPELIGTDLEIVWNPLASPTAVEQVGIDKAKAETDSILQLTGAIGAEDIRARLIEDPQSDYSNIAPFDEMEKADEELYAGLDAPQPLSSAPVAALPGPQGEETEIQ